MTELKSANRLLNLEEVSEVITSKMQLRMLRLREISQIKMCFWQA